MLLFLLHIARRSLLLLLAEPSTVSYLLSDHIHHRLRLFIGHGILLNAHLDNSCQST
jgi:hypothetical protein